MARCSRNSSQNHVVVAKPFSSRFPPSIEVSDASLPCFVSWYWTQPTFKTSYISSVLHNVYFGRGPKEGFHTAPFSYIDFQTVDHIGFLWNVSIHQPWSGKWLYQIESWKTRIVTKRDKCYNLMFRSQSHISSSKNSNGKLCEGKWRGMEDKSCGPKLRQEQII